MTFQDYIDKFQTGQLQALWDAQKNGGKPEQIQFRQGCKLWLKCEKGHEWTARSVSYSYIYFCPYCAGKKVLRGFNDLATAYPDLAKEWHSTKNGQLLATDVAFAQAKNVWWKCNNGHEWQATITARVRGAKCPYCSGKKVLKGFNDLATTHPNLAAEWHPTKNGSLTPEMITAHGNRKVWWKCKKCGYEWSSSLRNRTALGNGCHACEGRRVDYSRCNINNYSIKKGR